MRLALLWLLAGLAAAPAAAAEDELKKLVGQPLIELLRQGGLVVYVRHGAAERGIDEDPVGLGACPAQRSLSPLGRVEAEQLGAAFARFALPVARVLASPYCRALETAQLAFGPAEIRHELRLWQGRLPEAMRAALPTQARALLAQPPPAGGNTVVVAHNYKDLLGFDLQQGEAAVLWPDGKGDFAVLARVLPAEWAAHLHGGPEFLLASFALPADAKPDLFAGDGQGGLWLARRGEARLWHLAGRTGGWRALDLAADSHVAALASARDGTLWLLDSGERQLTSVALADLTVRRIALPGGGQPGALTVDREGQLWLVRGNALIRMDPASAWLETVAELPLAGGNQLVAWQGGLLGLSPLGLWRLHGRTIDVLPGPPVAAMRPADDGGAYILARDGELRHMAADGALRRLAAPAAGASQLAVDASGRLWLAGEHGLGRLDDARGDARPFDLGRLAGSIAGLVGDPDGGLWLLQPSAGRIVRLLPPVP
ncbi:MAG: hypothetical protein FJX68_14300 [Alphaproteobacteria bacterium]|nr:hypothetical protein [Alphaproteobacteria bacterium]